MSFADFEEAVQRVIREKDFIERAIPSSANPDDYYVDYVGDIFGGREMVLKHKSERKGFRPAEMPSPPSWMTDPRWQKHDDLDDLDRMFIAQNKTFVAQNEKAQLKEVTKQRDTLQSSVTVLRKQVQDQQQALLKEKQDNKSLHKGMDLMQGQQEQLKIQIKTLERTVADLRKTLNRRAGRLQLEQLSSTSVPLQTRIRYVVVDSEE